MTNQDGGWRELYDLTGSTTSHPEEDVQRRQLAAQDAARRARLPEWEAALPAAEAAVREKWAAVGVARAAEEEARAAVAAKYRRVVSGRGMRDPRLGGPIHWLDDERNEPERGRWYLTQQALSVAQTEHGQAVVRCQALIAEIASIKGTIPARA